MMCVSFIIDGGNMFFHWTLPLSNPLPSNTSFDIDLVVFGERVGIGLCGVDSGSGFLHLFLFTGPTLLLLLGAFLTPVLLNSFLPAPPLFFGALTTLGRDSYSWISIWWRGGRGLLHSIHNSRLELPVSINEAICWGQIPSIHKLFICRRSRY